MQACEVCGWDTRAGTRVCASCRAGLESGDIAPGSVLAGVLQQAREMNAGDAGRDPADHASATTSRRPRGPRRDDHGREQVVLREIGPGGDEPDGPHSSEPSSVAASLIEAFQSPRDTRPPADAAARTDSLRGSAVADLSRTVADEVEDDDATAAAATDQEAPTTQPAEAIADMDRLDAVTEPPSHDRDVVGEQAVDPARYAGPLPTTSPQARTSEPSLAGVSLDDPRPITDRFANIPTVPMDPGPSSDLPAVASPHTADSTSAPRAHGEVALAPDRDGGPTDAPPAVTTATGGPATSETPARRAAVREASTWTAVAQFTLLFIGMLCVFQVVVLLVVNQFLSQAQTQQAVAADMLAAHAKVATVMLPALVGGAFGAAAFAAWRARTETQQDDDTASLRRRILGLPVAIWAVIVTATVLLVVVLVGTSATVAGAQRMTMWAIGVCALLGVACVAAPRGLAAVDQDAIAGEAPRAGAARR